MKNVIKILAILVTIAIVIQAVPVGSDTNISKAVNENFVYSEFSKETSDEISKKLEQDEIFEIESLREENAKHFRVGDEVYQAAAYVDPVHRKNSDGKWQDIDNTLALEKDNEFKRYTT